MRAVRRGETEGAHEKLLRNAVRQSRPRRHASPRLGLQVLEVAHTLRAEGPAGTVHLNNNTGQRPPFRRNGWRRAAECFRCGIERRP